MKARNFRAKLSFQEDEGEEGGDAAAPPPPPAPKPKPKATDRKPGKPLLSFDEEEAGALAAGKKKERKFKRAVALPEPAALPTATQRQGAGEYTAERLAELQRNTINFSSTALAASRGDAATGVAIKGSFKKTPATGEDRCAASCLSLIRTLCPYWFE